MTKQYDVGEFLVLDRTKEHDYVWYIENEPFASIVDRRTLETRALVAVYEVTADVISGVVVRVPGDAISRRLKWWCKLIFPKIDTQKTKFEFSQYTRIRIPVFIEDLQLVETGDLFEDEPVLIPRYVPIEPKVMSLNLSSFMGTRHAIKIRVAYDEDTNVCYIHHI